MILAWLVLQLAGCGGGGERCDLAALLDDVAVDGAVDCGTAPLDDPASTEACMAEAFAAGEAFRGVTQRSDGDGLVARAWAGDAAGEVTVLLGVFDLCGDRGCRGTVVSSPCVLPVVEAGDHGAALRCTGEPACGELVCGGGAVDCEAD